MRAPWIQGRTATPSLPRGLTLSVHKMATTRSERTHPRGLAHWLRQRPSVGTSCCPHTSLEEVLQGIPVEFGALGNLQIDLQHRVRIIVALWRLFLYFPIDLKTYSKSMMRLNFEGGSVHCRAPSPNQIPSFSNSESVSNIYSNLLMDKEINAEALLEHLARPHR